MPRASSPPLPFLVEVVLVLVVVEEDDVEEPRRESCGPGEKDMQRGGAGQDGAETPKAVCGEDGELLLPLPPPPLLLPPPGPEDHHHHHHHHHHYQLEQQPRRRPR